jgi:cytochrome c oxidase subunit III
MTSDYRIVEEPKQPLAMNAKKFGMWLFLVSVGMLFAAFSSAYIVRQAEGNWVDFALPSLFYYTTAIIVLSSVSIQWAYFAAKRDEFEKVKVLVAITTAFGFAFLVGQVIGWKQMTENSIYLVGNPSGSFVYILTGLHGAHLLGGIVFLIIVLVSAFRMKIHSNNLLRLELCVTYWHFLGGLWIYLFVFLILNR